MIPFEFMVPETRVLQAADGEDLVILACTLLTEYVSNYADYLLTYFAPFLVADFGV